MVRLAPFGDGRTRRLSSPSLVLVGEFADERLVVGSADVPGWPLGGDSNGLVRALSRKRENP